MTTLLMSLDLEDVRKSAPEGMNYTSRVEKNAQIFLDYLKKKNWPCTFFTVGDIFEDYAELIQEIKRLGFELAWHTMHHRPLTEMDSELFYKDLMTGQEFAAKFGFSMCGFRAPIFSVNSAMTWFHPTLKKAGYKYSSSVLPAKNPLYGWEGFGQTPKRIDGIIEIPMTLLDLKVLKVPYGGVYLRLLPSCFFQYGIHQMSGTQSGLPIYIHPYDFDSEQERFMHGGINGSIIYNQLMYYNRKSMLAKLDKLGQYCSNNVSDYQTVFNKLNKEI